MSASRPRVLFFAEGATLAHVARPFVLARDLDPLRFSVAFARPAEYSWLTQGAPFQIVDLSCQDTATFIRRLDAGLPVYKLDTLQRYVQSDLALIKQIRPDVVVGDFRLSLSVSARLCRVPYITICDAYWSPECPSEDPPLPVVGGMLSRFVPLELARRTFRAVSPLLFYLHAAPVERLRSMFGFASLGHDLRSCYTDADLRLFANFPALFPSVQPTSKAAFLGPVAWSPPDRADLPLPEGGGALIYVTTGSSGNPRVLKTLLPLLKERGARVVLASAGRPLPIDSCSENTRVFDFVPGDQVCQMAQLVICNGGSPATNQALVRGVPVLGIARNMDQFLNMQAVENFGAGLLIRADRVDEGRLAKVLGCLLEDRRFGERARMLARAPIPTRGLGDNINALLVRSR